MSEFKVVDIACLEYDRQNPRLPTTVGQGDTEILKYLADKTAIEDLMTSIAENGFFLGEAIVVCRSDKPKKYKVLEGNRRLTALRLLQNPRLAAHRRRIAKIAEEAKHKPEKIPVYEVQHEGDAMQYLGFRHISGVQRWEPLAKARYLHRLFSCTSQDDGVDARYAVVARKIGSRKDAIQRNLDALAAYNAIEKKQFFGIEGLDEESFQFGLFYTAIGGTGIGVFVGVKDKNSAPTHSIVHSNSLNLKHLRELTEWIFAENDDGDTRLGESRNIGKLAEVVANPDSLKLFRQGASLDSAHQATVDNEKEFLRLLTAARESLKEASTHLHSIKSSDEDARERARDVRNRLGLILSHLKVKAQGDD